MGATGGKKTPIRKKRKFELARPAAMTKMAPQRIHTLRVRGGNKKYRALRLDQDSGQERHRCYRCCSLQTMVRGSLRSAPGEEEGRQAHRRRGGRPQQEEVQED